MIHPHRIYTIILTAAMAMGAAFGAAAQETARGAEAQGQAALEPKQQIKVSLLTCAPGDEVYSLEGHTALRIQKERGYDVTVNWGVFDFNSPNFVYRFAKGETDYMALAVPTPYFLEEYRREGRRVTEQQLSLTPVQAARLAELVALNLLPENRVYRYNYVLDNCATRPVAHVVNAADGAITLPDGPSVTTFRREMQRYHRNYPWYQFGIDLALGSGIDRPISRMEEGFAPVRMMQLLDSATIADSVGIARPLVARKEILVTGRPEGKAEGPTPWYLTPMTAALLLLAVTLVVTLCDLRRRRLSRWLDSALYSLFFLGGMAVVWLMLFSQHEATTPNWNLMWLNPLAIIPAVGIWIKSWKNAVYCYQICNFALLIVWLCASPWLPQVFNAAFYPLVMSNLLRSVAEISILRPAHARA